MAVTTSKVVWADVGAEVPHPMPLARSVADVLPPAMHVALPVSHPQSPSQSVMQTYTLQSKAIVGSAVGAKVLQPVPRLRSRRVVSPPSTHVSVTWSQPQPPPQSRTHVCMLQSGVGSDVVGTGVVGDDVGDNVVIEVGLEVRGSGVVVVACTVNPPPQPQHMSPIVKSASSKAGEHSFGFAL